MSHLPLSRFPIDTVAAVEIALSAGHFYYFDDFLPFVFNMIGAGNCEFVLAGVVELDVKSKGFLDAHEKVVADLCVEVPTLPRGHYMVIKIDQGLGKFWYKTVVSDGFGDRIATSNGGEYSSMPSAEDVRVKFIKFEIYKCRQAVDVARQAAKNTAAIKAHGLHVGYVHTGTFVQYVYAVHCFATILEIKSGSVHVQMTGFRGALDFTWMDAEDFVKRAALFIVPRVEVVKYDCQLELFAA